MRFSSILFATALVLSPLAFADDAIQLDLAGKPFAAQKLVVLHTVNNDEKYSEITVEKRNEVTKALDRINEILADDKPLSSVDANARQQALADQQLINKALEQAKLDSRMVCMKENVIGSNLPKRVCRTAAAQKRLYAETQDALKGKQKSMQVNVQNN